MTVLRILAYHAISDLRRSTPLWRYGVPLSDFQAQIDQLGSAGYTFVSAGQMLGFLAAREPCPYRPVLLTFDDGYVSVVAAARWLKRQGIPSVAFVSSGALTGECLQGTVESPLDHDGMARLVEAGAEIGAHGHTHRPLPGLSDRQQREEIEGALARLTVAGLGTVRLFAYPYGEHDAGVREQVRRAGATAAMTADPGLVGAGDDPYRLRRIEVFRGDTGLTFLTKVATGGGLSLVRARLRVRSRMQRWAERMAK